MSRDFSGTANNFQFLIVCHLNVLIAAFLVVVNYFCKYETVSFKLLETECLFGKALLFIS